jgi:hypothetical protein
MVWYDTNNDVLKTYDWTNWNEVGSGTADINTKTFYLPWTSWANSFAVAKAAIDWFKAGKTPIISFTNRVYDLEYFLDQVDTYAWQIAFVSQVITDEAPRDFYVRRLAFNFKDWNVTSIDFYENWLWLYRAGNWISIDSTNHTISNTLPWAVVSGTAPSNPSQWDMWYDTTEDTLNTYDGEEWNWVGWWGWWWDVLVSDQPNNILTSWMKIWAWTEANYQSLANFDSNTLYLTVE